MSKRLQRAALLAYPRSYRRERGAEILTTLDDLGADGRSWWQARSLLVAGLRTRAGMRGAWRPQAVAAGGLRIGAAMVAGGYALMLLCYAWQEREHRPFALLLVGSAWAVAALLVLRGPRPAGVWAVAAAAAASLAWYGHEGLHGTILRFSLLTLAAVVVPCVAALVAAARLAPPAGPVSPWWLLCVVPQALLLTGAVQTRYGIFISSAVIAVSAPLVIAALAVAPFDPRPAVAACVVLASVLLWLATVSAMGIYTWVAPLSSHQLIALALPAAVLAAGATAGLRRVTSPV
jgi:hypothetical protein